MIRRYPTDTPVRTWVNRANKRWTFWPKRMTSGKILWWGDYYCIEELRNVEPRHMWIKETTYTPEEYFLQRLSE